MTSYGNPLVAKFLLAICKSESLNALISYRSILGDSVLIIMAGWSIFLHLRSSD